MISAPLQLYDRGLVPPFTFAVRFTLLFVPASIVIAYPLFLFALFVVLLLAAAALRARKLRRDEHREVDAPVERRLTAPPPSPYTPSKGFRLLDGPVNEPLRPVPPRPRLEPGREYVFSESQLPDYVKSVSPLGRHDVPAALEILLRQSEAEPAGRTNEDQLFMRR